MSESKKCVYCGEKVRLKAKKCKYCGEWLEEESLSESNLLNVNEGSSSSRSTVVNKENTESDFKSESDNTTKEPTDWLRTIVFEKKKIWIVLISVCVIYFIVSYEGKHYKIIEDTKVNVENVQNIQNIQNDGIDYVYVATRNDGQLHYFLELNEENENYAPLIVCTDKVKSRIVEILDFDINSEFQTQVYDERDELTQLDLNDIRDFHVIDDKLYFVGFSSILKYGIYFCIRVDLSTEKLKMIAYGLDMDIDKKTGELNYEQRRLTNDAEFGYQKEFETIYLKTRLK